MATATKHKPARKSLRTGETYNPKTKRYEFKYVDALGKRRTVSSYTLDPTDLPLKGKASGKSLREKEAEVLAMLANNIDVDGSKFTLLECVDRYLAGSFDSTGVERFSFIL